MFLITTAEEQSWRSDGPVLFLGEWCKLDSRRPAWEPLNAVVHPYHWDDRDKLYRDACLVSAIYRRLLPRLAAAFNNLHNLDRPERYWEVVAGFWFKVAITVLLDRWEVVRTLGERGEPFETVVFEGGLDRCTGGTSADFANSVVTSDRWNHGCFARMLAEFDNIRIETVPAPTTRPPAAPKPRRSELKARLSGALEWLARRTPDALNRVVLATPMMAPLGVVRLQVSLGQLPYLRIPTLPVEDQPPRPELQRRLRLDPGAGASQFESLLAALLPDLAPLSLVEDFARLRARALECYPDRPRLIFTANAHVGNDGFCIWAAEQRLRGVPLCIGQHGGHLGVDRWEHVEDHELSIADCYFSWGWRKQSHDIIQPMPSTRLSAGTRGLRAKPQGGILFVYDDRPRYAYRMLSMPVGVGQSRRYVADNVALIQALPAPVRALAMLRPYVVEYGCGMADGLERAGLGDRIDRRGLSLNQALAASRLCVNTANATVILETLSRDFPTVAFWDPKYWELRAEAEPYYQMLREAGILFDTPAAAAAHIAAIAEDPAGWWSGAKVQDARRRFVDVYARRSKDWCRQWRTTLRELSRTGAKPIS